MTILGEPITALEVLANIANLMCVYLTARNKWTNWLWGIVGVILYAALFCQAKLYSDMLLQLAVFLPLQFYGLWRWKHAGPDRNKNLRISWLGGPRLAVFFVLTTVLGCFWGQFMEHNTSAAQPYADALLAAFSVFAQFLDCERKVENWVIWIAVDIVSAFVLYPARHLYVTAIVYIIFLLLDCWALCQWVKILERKNDGSKRRMEENLRSD